MKTGHAESVIRSVLVKTVEETPVVLGRHRDTPRAFGIWTETLDILELTGVVFSWITDNSRELFTESTPELPYCSLVTSTRRHRGPF